MTRQEWMKDTIRKSLLAVAIIATAICGTAGIVVASSELGVADIKHYFGGCLNCNCRRYEQGFDGLCTNCGHRFSRHY